MRWVIRFLLLLILVGAGAGWFWWDRMAPLEVATVQATRGPATLAVYATGVVEAGDLTTIGPVQAGRLVTVAKREGEPVAAGETLLVLEDVQARARLSEAEARLALAQSEAARSRALAEGGTGTVQARQRTEAEARQARANVDMITRALTDLTVTAPFAGFIVERRAEPGQAVAANATVLTLASARRLRIAADVDERDIARIAVGARVVARADAFPEQVFEGRIDRMRPTGDSATRTFRIEMNLPPETILRVGMTLDVNVILEERTDVLLVPPGVVVRAPARGGRPGDPLVWLVVEGRLIQRPIKVGVDGTRAVEVREGLSETDRIVAIPTPRLAVGREAVDPGKAPWRVW